MGSKNLSDSERRGGAAPGGRLYKRVADELRAAILSGRYTPGRRLPAERELGEMFNVSRPTVREAVIALELQGLVEVRVGAGVFVLEPNTAQRARGAGAGPELMIGPFELMEARKIIESETAALAVASATSHFGFSLGGSVLLFSMEPSMRLNRHALTVHLQCITRVRSAVTVHFA